MATTAEIHAQNVKAAQDRNNAPLPSVPAFDEPVAPVSPLVPLIESVTFDTPEIPAELEKALRDAYTKDVRWIRLDEVDWLTESQIRQGQPRKERSKEFAPLMREYPLRLPPVDIVARPASGEYAHVKGTNNPFVGSDGYARKGACEIMPELFKTADGDPAPRWWIYPARVHQCPEGMNPVIHALWIAAGLNATGPDQMDGPTKRAASVRMIRDSGGMLKGPQVAERLGLTKQTVYNAINADWAERVLIERGADPNKTKVLKEDAKLFVYSVLSLGTTEADGTPEQRRAIVNDRIKACVQLVNIGVTTGQGLRAALKGWETNHTVVTDAMKAQPRTPSAGSTGNGAKSGPKVPVQADSQPPAPKSNIGQYAEDTGDAHGPVDPAIKIASAVRSLLHNEDVNVTELASDMLASHYTANDVERIIKPLVIVRDALRKAESEAAKKAAETDGAKVA